ncbi:ribulokinase [Ruminococcaceae bacterium OttesenSCG-928-L11]|nr:ribulokinase [Ruminococcaceae bacterium OttesenSCG-928-L11]
MASYTIGVDFGTLSGRALLADTATGAEVSHAAMDYPHGVMSRCLPDGTALGLDWALQHPQDYLDVMATVIPAVLAESGVSPDEVRGIAVDCTASTFFPVRRDGTPLCFLPEYAGNPHAWPKLWKHHAPQDKANRLTELALARKEPWLPLYGGRVSSEWQLPKVWETLDSAPEIYDAADFFVEAADWITWMLCGNPAKASSIAGYKGFWRRSGGYPSPEWYRAVDPRLADYVPEKLGYPMADPGERVGRLTAAMAAQTGLREGIAVAAASIDAHVTLPAAAIDRPGAMLAIMGTSTCHLLLGERETAVPGICGVAQGGIYPGWHGYEAGQSCVGDHFAWFIDNCLPAAYRGEAEQSGQGIHALLREKARRLAPGESGLLALDWWNGNRSVLVDVDLTGLFLGMTLQTRPEELYRALIEATAFGTRKIIENFRDGGLTVTEFVAAGGISRKDPLTMQIYADVIGLPVHIAGSVQGPALGSAIYAAVAAGLYPDILAAARAMGRLEKTVYRPIPEHCRVYDRLYAEYDRLHEYFGRGENDVMKRLKSIRREAGLERKQQI